MADSSPSSSGAASFRAGHRALNEPVLSSVEDELDLPSGEFHTDPRDMSGQPNTEDTAHASEPDTPPWWQGMQTQVTRYVSEQPGRAALMALGAGALAALLLGRGIGGRRRKD